MAYHHHPLAAQAATTAIAATIDEKTVTAETADVTADAATAAMTAETAGAETATTAMIASWLPRRTETASRTAASTRTTPHTWSSPQRGTTSAASGDAPRR